MNQPHERANLLVELGRYEQALPVFTEAIPQAEDATERAEIFADMAACLAKLGRFGQAEQLFRDEVLPYLSTDEWAMHRFVVILINSGKQVEADAINQQLLSAYPNSSLHYVIDAKLLRQQRRFVDAWSAIQEARRLDPDSAYAQEEQLTLLACWQPSSRKPITPLLDMAVPNWEAVVEEAVARAPSDPTIRLLAGEIYAKKSQPAKAQQHLLDALQLDPSYQPYIVNSLQHVLTLQQPLMRALLWPFRRVPESWALGLVVIVPMLARGLIDLASSRGINLVTSLLGICLLMLIPTLGIYFMCRVLVEFTPVGQIILSERDKWRNRLQCLALWLFFAISTVVVLQGLR
ncbi:tetratricopeptide repeat protein [Fibrella aestuarina]|uniref:tetratricopeptide repeat protein n=1 Tax=Fibrella aestuarina TaxID=651143 RepID=UPI00030D141A|nr:tetratricopeptide repeat protein [Fibrella aestuarina]